MTPFFLGNKSSPAAKIKLNAAEHVVFHRFSLANRWDVQ
jgi:hypothetical protein